MIDSSFPQGRRVLISNRQLRCRIDLFISSSVGAGYQPARFPRSAVDISGGSMTLPYGLFCYFALG